MTTELIRATELRPGDSINTPNKETYKVQRMRFLPRKEGCGDSAIFEFLTPRQGRIQEQLSESDWVELITTN